MRRVHVYIIHMQGRGKNERRQIYTSHVRASVGFNIDYNRIFKIYIKITFSFFVFHIIIFRYKHKMSFF